jgi:predicted nucleic acid-binding Zn ribbon protein
LRGTTVWTPAADPRRKEGPEHSQVRGLPHAWEAIVRTKSDSPTKNCSEPGCSKALRARGYCSGHWKQHFATRAKYAITCIVCGSPHESARANGKFCSDSCRAVDYKARDRVQPSRRALAAMRLACAARGTRSRRRWVAGRCYWCGEQFVSQGWGGLGRFCRPRCMDRAKGAARRVRKRQAERQRYSRHAIFERDGWRCHLCRKSVRRGAVAPHPLAPTIDHLIPLAKGGSDTPANVATAHFLCNSTKSDRGGGEQLALIG